MNFVVWFLLCLYVVIFWPIYIVTEAPHKALIFSRKTSQLEEISGVYLKKKCYSCIIACPAAAISERSEKFNDKVSFGQNSIFLQDVYNDVTLAEKIDLEICREMFKPSILLHKESDSYNTGYELYYEEEKCKLKSIWDSFDYNDFKSVLGNAIKKSKTFPKIVSEKDKKTRFRYRDKQIMSFFWIPVLTFDFDPVEYQIRITFYSDIINNYTTILNCKDYELGYELYKSDENVNFFYSTSNPKEMFDKIDFASRQSSNSQTASPCAQSDKCLERTHLIPMMFLHTKAAKLATCTYLNTIPVWSSIIDGQLKIVDRYLYTIFRLWYPNIDIVFGVSGELTLKNVQNSATAKISSSAGDQNDEGQMKIPKIIYRIVEYELSKKMDEVNHQNVNDDGQNGEKNDDKNVLFHYIVIIIHNDPEASVGDILCPTQIKSLSNDWEAIYIIQ